MSFTTWEALAMPGRPTSLLLATVLLLVIGLSGASVGVTLITAMASAPDVPSTGIGIGAGIAGYGAVAAIAGIGVLLRWRPGWWLGLATIVAGLLFLTWLIVALGGLDAVFAFGLVVWAVTLVCLLAPPTRAALGVRLRG